MNVLISFIGLLLVLSTAFFISNNRSKINYKKIIQLFVLQLIVAFFFLKTSIGIAIVGVLAHGFEALLAFAHAGIDFVFGGIETKASGVFFFNALLPIIFVSALLGILQYIKILPFVMKWIGKAISKITGMGHLEAYNGIGSSILGQSEVFISLKKELPELREQQLITMGISAMSTASMAILGSYMTLLQPHYVITAMGLNLFGGFLIASIVNPYEVNQKSEVIFENNKEQTFFQMLGEYILDGFKVAMTVTAMLIGFVSLMAMINALFKVFTTFTFQEILGYLFAPLAFLTGIPWHEAIVSGNIMATKLVTNEFVAILTLTDMQMQLSERTTAILSIYLISFTNFSSIGILSGAMKGLNEEKGNLLAKHGLKILFSATLVGFLNAIIAGLFL